MLHLTLVPYLKSAGELKTKPSQHSVKQLSEAGVQPDILICRAEQPLPRDVRKKLALFCNVDQDSVIEALDAETIYDVPLLMQAEKLDERVLEKLRLPIGSPPDLTKWKAFVQKVKNPEREILVGLVGKYVELHDAYKSIAEAFIHAGTVHECKVKIKWIQSEKLEHGKNLHLLEGLEGILVAPGFGDRGVEGKLHAIRYAREQKIPFLGICLGMQCACVEFARNVLDLDAASTELHPQTPHPIIGLMESQKNLKNLGGTMRLGAYPCQLKGNTKVYEAYKTAEISERHRHRYEFNNDYLLQFEEAGMICSGINPESKLVEIVELKNHPWFVGTQFHPELKSTVENPHPLFVSFVQAIIKYANAPKQAEYIENN